MAAAKTQDQILAYLDRHPSAPADDIAQVLDVTKENIQYHLKKLLRDGIVTRTTLSAKDELLRGRPTYLYRLSDQSRPGNIPELADKLLEIVLTANPPLSSQPAILEQLASRMFSFQAAANPTQNLRQSMQRLNQHHYQAAWEARASGPMVYFRNCPYASLVKDHPQLCQLDCAILAALLHRPVAQVAKMDLDSRKPPACIFQIQPAPIN
jgi:predicted ArsR family transcriptional regulator